MNSKGPNHPFVVWSSCILWVISIFSILWSLLLFFCVSDMLFLTGTDLVNAVVLLSGIIMLPTNLYIVYAIANGQRIEYTAKVFCCRLWMSIVWIIIINLIGVILCIQRIYLCEDITMNYLSNSVKQYRTIPKHKHFIDNLQWSLGCCGVRSYRDWFTRNWHDKIRDFDWSPINERSATLPEDVKETDSVPLRYPQSLQITTYTGNNSLFVLTTLNRNRRSCCKSGSCVSSYLKELGTYSINTNGCGQEMYRIIMISMNAHLMMFVFVIILEGFLLKHIILKKNKRINNKSRKFKLNNIMSVNDNFDVSSASYQLNAEDSEELEISRHCKDIEEN